MAALGILQLTCWREEYGQLLSPAFFAGQSDEVRAQRWTQMYAASSAAPAQLWVAAENLRAIAFYRKHGFAFDGTSGVVELMENLSELRMTR